jgi:PKD repeat protein
MQAILHRLPLPVQPENAMSPGTYATPSPLIGASNPSQAPPNASLLDVPAYGTAPLTVDFYVGIANPRGPLVYEWNFGDGTVSLMPGGPYMLTSTSIPGLTCARSI